MSSCSSCVAEIAKAFFLKWKTFIGMSTARTSLKDLMKSILISSYEDVLKVFLPFASFPSFSEFISEATQLFSMLNKRFQAIFPE